MRVVRQGVEAELACGIRFALRVVLVEGEMSVVQMIDAYFRFMCISNLWRRKFFESQQMCSLTQLYLCCKRKQQPPLGWVRILIFFFFFSASNLMEP